MTNPEFSIVIPVYNSGNFLKSLINDVSDVFVSVNKTYEIVLVNDSSLDNSLELMSEMKMEKYLPVAIVDLKRNVGQYAATIVGLSVAKGNYLITMDADFCPPPLHIKTLIENISSNEAVIYGEMHDMQRSSFRKYGGFIFNTLIKYSLCKTVSGSGSSFRLISKSLLNKVLQNIREPLLLDIKLINAAAQVDFIPIPMHNVYKSSHSKSKLITNGLSLLKGIIFERLYFRKVFVPQDLINNPGINSL